MIKFTKMHGLGNDYIYIDCFSKSVVIENICEYTKFISNRNFGVGADGVILICKSKVADFKMKMYNYDGSEAEMCGNGIRCLAKFVYEKKLTNKKEFSVETLAGVKNIKLEIINHEVKNVIVDMGEPIFIPEKIPVIFKGTSVKNLKIMADDKSFSFTCVSMGNPHAVTLVKDVKNFNVNKYGKILEYSDKFPNRANIEFVEILDNRNIFMRVWERGTGETLACGTGACASVVACNLNGFIKNEASVSLLGGKLYIKWNKINNHVYMEGPAVTVFEGYL